MQYFPDYFKFLKKQLNGNHGILCMDFDQYSLNGEFFSDIDELYEFVTSTSRISITEIFNNTRLYTPYTPQRGQFIAFVEISS